MIRNILYCIFLFLVVSTVWAQPNADSLLKIWNNKRLEPEKRMKALSSIAWDVYLYANPDTSFYYAKKLYDFASLKNNEEYISDALNTMGNTRYLVGDYKGAVKYHEKNLALAKKLKDSSKMAAAYSNISSALYEQGNYPKSLEYQFQSLRLEESMKNYSGIANSYNTIGVLYQAENDHKRAMVYFEKAVKAAKKSKDDYTLASALTNMAVELGYSNQRTKAINYYLRSLKIFEEQGDFRGVSTVLNNLATLNTEEGKFEQAKAYLDKSMAIQQRVGDKEGIASSFQALGFLYYKWGDCKKSVFYSQQGLKIAKEIGSLHLAQGIAENLYKAFKQTKDFKGATEMHEYYVAIKDSLSGIEAQKGILQQEFKYAYDKKTLSDSLKRNEERRVNKVFQEQEQTKRTLLYFGLALAFVFGWLVVLRFRKTSRQKEMALEQTRIVEMQRVQIEEKQREVMDSIYYARRIQEALLPSLKYFDKNIQRLKEKEKK